jgi:hypothetical protein
VSYQNDIIPVRNLTARQALGQITTQSRSARDHRRSREIVEVVEYLVSGEPRLKQRRDASVVFKLAERVEAGKARYKHDVKTLGGGGPRVLIGHGVEPPEISRTSSPPSYPKSSSNLELGGVPQHACNFELRLLPNSSGEHEDSAHQRQPAEYRRNRHVLMFFGSRVDRTDIKNFFLMGVVETLVGKGKTAQNNKENSTPN